MKAFMFTIGLVGFVAQSVHGASVPWMQRYSVCVRGLQYNLENYVLPNGWGVLNTSPEMKDAIIFPGTNGDDGGVWFIGREKAEFLPIPGTQKTGFLGGKYPRGYLFSSEPGSKKSPDTAVYIQSSGEKPTIVVSGAAEQSEGVKYENAKSRPSITTELKSQYEDFLAKTILRIEKINVPEPRNYTIYDVPRSALRPESKDKMQGEVMKKVNTYQTSAELQAQSLKALTSCREALSAGGEEERKLINIIDEKLLKLTMPDGDPAKPKALPAKSAI